jgi:SNF2 family DNA or RNA helicase
MAMSTQTGGVSLNLERAGSVHILDEMWNPDRQEQLEDRGDRGTRTTPLICYYYRTEETVQEYIAKVGAGKKITNSNVLDVYRQMRRAGFGN